MRRRTFLQAGLASVLTAKAFADAPRAPRILLRSSWQVVNIGDIAHTPGVLALLGIALPVGGGNSLGVRKLDGRGGRDAADGGFRGCKLSRGISRRTRTASTPELEDAVRWADFLLHGSGPSFVAHKDVAAFVEKDEKAVWRRRYYV